ncbi:MAG: hypothetical protein EBR91_09900 [Flavobacteriia bacterium]|nr:hypothetical protein [Flavobacteriia bacterium]
MEGNIVGKYKLIRIIGEGGMASVYEAEHKILGTKAAVKILNPMLSGDAQIRERFRNEAKLMASLNHPNITRIIDFDEQPHQLSIVMEYLEGADLNDKIKRNGPLSPMMVKDIFVQTLSAFQYAHEKGIVHRDIKPSNIFILKNGHVKILDFGIAKLFGQGNEMTQTGTQMGTPIYMSPEQVKADKSIDHRSDIYSLGVTMFYALHGKPPYNSDTDSQFDIFSKIVYEPLPVSSISGDFTELILKACNKNREERFQSCEEWINKLESINRSNVNENEIKTKNNSSNFTPRNQENAPVSTEKLIPKKNRKRFLLAGIILIVIAITGIVLTRDPYDSVTIGKQVWMTKNLEVDEFRNGDPIPQAKSAAQWVKAGENHQPAWCYYKNNPKNGKKYGKLYNWYAVSDPRGLAPKGYHIPTDAEWTVLTDYLGGESSADKKMKSASGWFENGNGTNSSGFSGLPGGYCSYDGTFYSIGKLGYWWSATEFATCLAWLRYLYYNDDNVYRDNYSKDIGLSVRCLEN